MLDAIKEMETKQKVMLVVTVLLFALVGYLLWGMIFPSNVSQPKQPALSAQKPASQAKAPAQAPAANKPASTQQPQAQAPAQQQAPAAQQQPARQQPQAAQQQNIQGAMGLPQQQSQQQMAPQGQQPFNPMMPGQQQQPMPQGAPNQSTIGHPTTTGSMAQPIPAQAPHTMPQQQTVHSQAKTVGGITEVPKQPLTPAQLAVLEQSKKTEAQYVELLNQYQIAQLQQKLVATNAQIAESRLRSAQLEAKTQEVSNQLTGQGSLKPTAATTAAKNIEVAYIGQQKGRWQAMLTSGGSYFQVTVGTQLQNGARVTAISPRGVTIMQDGEKHFIAMPDALN
ncbi:MAG: hypothetical protein CMF50_09535 [Legionellales bacterium]|nr:hypothetical protein [Legionellales bacterium]